MNNLIHDLPSNAAGGLVPILLDGSASFSITVPQGAGYMWTERYAQKKESFTPEPIGSLSNIRPSFYLVKEQNFRDIGAGFFEFDKVFANIPETWSETQQFAFNYTAERFVTTIGAGGTSAETFQTSKSVQVSTRVTHTYQIYYPADQQAGSLVDPIYEEGFIVTAGTYVRPPEVNVYMGKIYEIKTFTLLTNFTA